MGRMRLIHKSILLLLLFPSLALAQIDIPVQTLGNYFQAGHNLTWGSSGTGGFNNNFVLPGLGGITVNLCVYVQNNNPSNDHQFSFKAYATSNPQVKSFTGDPLDWTPLQLNSAYFQSGSQVSLTQSPASPFLIIGATGAKIALSFSGSGMQSGSPDTANIWGSYTYGTSCSAYVSGSPEVIYFNPTLSVGAAIPLMGRVPGTLFPLDVSSINACTFNLKAVNGSGTTPTLNLYLQDYDESNSMFNDRVSFVQATTGTSTQQASVSFSGNQNPAATKTGTLTPGSVVSGPLSDELYLTSVLGGTTPVYSVTLTGHCN